MGRGFPEDGLWLSGMTRTGSEGSLPAYSAVATSNGILGRQSGMQEQISRGTFSRVPPPTLIEMEDMGEDLEADLPPPPGTTPVVLPSTGISSVPSPPPQPGMTLRSSRIF